MVVKEKEVGEEDGDPSCYGDTIGVSAVVTQPQEKARPSNWSSIALEGQHCSLLSSFPPPHQTFSSQAVVKG